MDELIVEPALNGWRRIKDFQPDPQVTSYLVIPVGRPLDLAQWRDGRFVDYYHSDWELDVLYWMPIPNSPQELNQWFYGEPNGYRLRTQPPWISEEEWNETLRGERERTEQLTKAAPVGSAVRFKSHQDKTEREGTVESVSPSGYMVQVADKEHWFVEPEQLVALRSGWWQKLVEHS